MKVLTLNCRGLNNSLKRHLFYKHFLKYNICCLQESYITNKTATLWGNEWAGSHFFFQPGTNHSKGLIILINKSFVCNEVKEIKINERCLGISFIVDDKPYVIFNFYAPSVKEERLQYLEDLPDLLQGFPPDINAIMCGDFNMVTSHDCIISGAQHEEREIRGFNTFVNYYHLNDTWESKNPFSKDYSWSRFYNKDNCNNGSFTPFIARRLDYLFCNDNLMKYLSFSDMIPFSLSDHKAVVSFFKLDDYKRGPSTWKFNDSLVDSEEFVTCMSRFITNTIIDLDQEQSFTNNDKWDLLKISIRDKCMSFVRNLKFDESESDILESEIKMLTSKLSRYPDDHDLIRQVLKLTTKKEINDLSKSKGALKRSRASFIEENEKSTKYFLGLERYGQSQKTIKEIFDDNNILVQSPEKIIKVISSFYETLMNTNASNADHENLDNLTDNLDNFLRDIEHPILDEQEKLELEAPITIIELEKALLLLNKDSSPGSDGLTAIFYITFWKQIKTLLFKSIEESIVHKSLTLSQRRAIITLLPKGNDLEQLKHISRWRPISLTNLDYKLYSKVLAIRLQSVLHTLINENQVGFLKNRSINDHIRLIDDMINISNKNNLQGMLISLDFQKAFDSVSKNAIIACMKRFNFGPIYTNYVTTILNDTEASVKNAGWLSSWFTTSRGVRQGCCLSPLLFILVVECLAIKIRSNDNIKSMAFVNNNRDKETKLLQYADDITLLIQCIESLSLTLKEIDTFKQISGLILNREKSIGMWLGINKGRPPGGEGIKWLKDNENIKILGIYYNANTEASLIEQNWNTKIEEVKRVMAQWSRRNISLWGKSIIVKTFILSKLNYILQSLCLPDHVLKLIDSLIFKFIWKSGSNITGHERIKRTTLCLDVSEGGISMISIKDQQHVMLLKWMLKINNNKNSIHYAIVNEIMKGIGGIEYFLNCNTNILFFKGLNTVKNGYWQKAITAWIPFDKSIFAINNDLSLTIFNNKDILHHNMPLFINKWIHSNFKYLYQLLRVDGQIKTYQEVQNEIGPYGGLLLDYMAVCKAVVKSGINLISINHDPATLNIILPLISNKVIRRRIASKQGLFLNCTNVWLRKQVNISLYFTIGLESTKESRLRLLHFNIIHNSYPTNVLLTKMRIKQSNKCDFCQETDFLEHFFYECHRLQQFWHDIEYIMVSILNQDIKVNTSIALLGITKDNTTANSKRIKEANHMLLIARMSISKLRNSDIKNIKYIFEYEMLLRKKHFTTLGNHSLF